MLVSFCKANISYGFRKGYFVTIVIQHFCRNDSVERFAFCQDILFVVVSKNAGQFI